MRKGSYSRPVPLTRYRAKHFPLHLFASDTVGVPGCGATALATITGTDPRHYLMLNGNKAACGDVFMKKRLELEGYEVIPLTKRGLNTSKIIEYPVENNNVLLVSQLVARNTTTWMVYYAGLSWHNFQVGRVEALDFINKPTITAYCVWHPSWSIPYYISPEEHDEWIAATAKKAAERKALLLAEEKRCRGN